MTATGVVAACGLLFALGILRVPDGLAVGWKAPELLLGTAVSEAVRQGGLYVTSSKTVIVSVTILRQNLISELPNLGYCQHIRRIDVVSRRHKVLAVHCADCGMILPTLRTIDRSKTIIFMTSQLRSTFSAVKYMCQLFLSQEVRRSSETQGNKMNECGKLHLGFRSWKDISYGPVKTPGSVDIPFYTLFAVRQTDTEG